MPTHLMSGKIASSKMALPPLDLPGTPPSISNTHIWLLAAHAAVLLPGANKIVSGWTTKILDSRLSDLTTNATLQGLRDVYRRMATIDPSLVQPLLFATVVIMANESKILPQLVNGWKSVPTKLHEANVAFKHKAKGLIQILPSTYKALVAQWNSGKGYTSLLKSAKVDDLVQSITPQGSEVLMDDLLDPKFDLTRPQGQVIPTILYMTDVAWKISNDWEYKDGAWQPVDPPRDARLLSKMDAIAPGIRADKELGVQLLATMMVGDGVNFYKVKDTTFHHVTTSTNRYLDDVKLYLWIKEKLKFDLNSAID